MSKRQSVQPSEEGNTTANPQNPKKLDKQAARATAEARARKLLEQAIEKIGKAEGMDHDASRLADRFNDLKKKSIRTYWEAGKLLAEAREAAPHGTWGKLRVEAGLAPTTEYLWRDLYHRVTEEEIDRLIGLGYSISRVIDQYRIGKKKTGQPKSLPAPGQETSGDGDDESTGNEDEESTGNEDDGSPTIQADSLPKPPMDALRVWKEEKGKGGPVVHAANWRGKILCSGRVIDHAADTLGNEDDITCIKCLGIRARDRNEAERREREKTPHGSEIGYVWELLDGDDPDAIDARWLPIKEVHGQVIVTPEKTFGPGTNEPVFGDRFEALENAKAKYQHLVEQDRDEIERLKSEEARLRKEMRLAVRKVQVIEAKLAREPRP